jgi:hypothetical protein
METDINSKARRFTKEVYARVFGGEHGWEHPDARPVDAFGQWLDKQREKWQSLQRYLTEHPDNRIDTDNSEYRFECQKHKFAFSARSVEAGAEMLRQVYLDLPPIHSANVDIHSANEKAQVRGEQEGKGLNDEG